jgi:4-hydroxy-3-polyprenylbenzoate decarboxylase
MDLAAHAGAVIFPPIPTFYGREQTLEDVIRGAVGRALSRMGIENTNYTRWKGISKNHAL